MKMMHWLIAVGFVAALAACDSDDDNDDNTGTGGNGTGGMPVTGGSGGSSTGGSGGSATGGSGGTAPTTIADCQAKGYTDAMCGKCMEANCAKECEDCIGNVNCTGYLQCLLEKNCTTTACADECLEANPGGDVPLSAWLDDCMATKCKSQCGSGAACGLTVGDATCDNCFNSKCESECEAFVGEPTWGDWIACYQKCSGASCYDDCDEQYPQAASTGEAFFGCMNEKCTKECGAGTDCGLTVNNTECDNCFDTQCNAECKAFAGDANWQAWIKCYGDCDDDACYEACDASFPTAATTGEAFFGCMNEKCTKECGAGTDCGLTVGNTECDACFDDKCNAECKAFAGDANWQAWIKCYGDCDDDDVACYEACDTSFPTAATTGEAFFGCMNEKCTKECGAGTDCGLTVGDKDCDACFDTQCNAECKAFVAEDDWKDWIDCLGACDKDDDDCFEACDTQFADAAAAGEAFFGCMEGKCAKECAGGTDCGLTVNDKDCDACFDTKCNTECKAFVAEDDWEDWVGCLKACDEDDDDCIEACDTQFADAAAAGEAFFTCMETECAVECTAGPI